jgi:hypothetical protein
MMGWRRLHFGVVALRLVSRIHLSAGTGCRYSAGTAGLNRRRAGGVRVEPFTTGAVELEVLFCKQRMAAMREAQPEHASAW